MSVARTRSISLLGLAGSVVDVEADLAAGLPALSIIGLADTALSEARDRVRSAASNAGCPLPSRKLTVNLSPASLPKHGSTFDLAIALACLGAAGEVPAGSLDRVVHLGELGLDGRLRPIRGVLPAVAAAVRAGYRMIMVPTGNLAEARLVPDADVTAVASLRDAAIWHGASYDPIEVDPVPASVGGESDDPTEDADLADVVGQDDAVEALLTAAVGAHHLLLLGTPGAGKTMLATRLRSILPDLDAAAAMEATALRSLAGHSVGNRLSFRPPFESPHHNASIAAMIGGGSGVIRPGAAARASHGVLFLDEAPEFPAKVLDALRQPLESGTISIHRANAVAEFPGRFQLVLAANPCPCGRYGSSDQDCTCPPNARRRYHARMSGPLLDRVDIQLDVPRITLAQLRGSEPGGRTTTAQARVRVADARAASAERLRGTGWRVNAEVPGPWLRRPAMHPGGRATAVLDRALERGGITMRGYDRVLRVAWSLADLDGVDALNADLIGRALYLRKGI